MWEGLRMEPRFRFPFAVMRYRFKLPVWTSPHANPTLNAAYAVSRVVLCQTHSMDMLCWRPSTGLLQDCFRDGVMGIIWVCAVLFTGNSADGLFSPRLFFWNPLSTSVLLYGFCSAAFLIMSSFPFTLLHFSLCFFPFCFNWLKFLVLPVGKKRVTWDFCFTQARDIERYS